MLGIGFGIGFAQSRAGHGSPAVNVSVQSLSSSTTIDATGAPSTVACPLAAASGTAESVPVVRVCSAADAPHFDSAESAMYYLASAWNSGNVQQIDYVTDPAGRQELNAMAAQMVDLKLERCSANPAGDYTCFFSHQIAPSTSPTTYPNPQDYPPGEAVFTVAPAAGPGWYLTQVIHCG